MAAIIIDIQNCFIFILLSFFTYFIFFRKQKDSKIDFKFPPSPPSLPIIGHLHLILSVLPHKSFQKISTKYGPFLRLQIFSFPLLLVSSASMAYEIHTTHDVNVSSRGDFANNESLLMGSSGFGASPYGNYFKFMKKLVATKLLGPQAIVQSRAIRAEELGRFYFNLVDKAAKKECVEIHTEAMKLTNSMICKMTMGRSCSDESGEAGRVRELINKFFNMTHKISLSKFLSRPLAKVGISLFKKEIMSLSNGFDELIERFLVEHEEKLGEHQDRDMMDLLLEAYRDEKAEYKITRNHIKSFFVDIFCGGIDTSARTIQWMMAEILNNPNILEKLTEEIDTVVGQTRLIQETDIPNLPYLQAVVKEGLRLHPPVPFVGRMFQTSCEIKEFYIPENTTLLINLYAVMRDPNVWEDPDEFKPERFVTSSRSEVEAEMREKGIKYIPFGAGRRGCPGSNLGYIFVETAVGIMVQCFDWKINGDKVHLEEGTEGMTLTMAHPLKCTPTVRIDPLNFKL